MKDLEGRLCAGQGGEGVQPLVCGLVATQGGAAGQAQCREVFRLTFTALAQGFTRYSEQRQLHTQEHGGNECGEQMNIGWPAGSEENCHRK